MRTVKESSDEINDSRELNTVFKHYIEEQLMKIDMIPANSLLTQQAVSQFRASLQRSALQILSSTWTHMVALEMENDNPLAILDPRFLTDDQLKEGERIIMSKMAAGEIALPGPVDVMLRQYLDNRTAAAIEMLQGIYTFRKEIARTFMEGKSFNRIEDICFGAGDTHRYGRNVCILMTDAGKIVYKPRNLRGDIVFHELAERYFGGIFKIPDALMLTGNCGVCEYIDKRRAEGEEEAAAFYRNMGILTAVFKTFGSADMHVDNISCIGTMPVIMDMETFLSPVRGMKKKPDPWEEIHKVQYHSPLLLTILPKKGPGEYEFSALMNTDETGCAPLVGGNHETVLPYLDQYMQGYHEGYQKLMKNHKHITDKLLCSAAGIEVRVLLANSQAYYDVQKKLLHYSALDTTEHSLQTRKNLLKGLKRNTTGFDTINRSIVDQLLRCDIPSFYTCGDSTDLLADGQVLKKDYFLKSPLTHVLENMDGMGEADEAFDLALLKRSFDQYPARLREEDQGTIRLPVIGKEILDPEEALQEAQSLFEKIWQMALVSPEGKHFWGQKNIQGSSFQLCDIFLADGSSGIALFASAVCHLSEQEEIREKAYRILQEYFTDLDKYLQLLGEEILKPDTIPDVGEASGLGGILTALALIRRYQAGKETESLQKKILGLLADADMNMVSRTDRISGLAGLLSGLCRFPEYRTETELIRRTAQRLIDTQSLEWNGKTLWQSFPDIRRPVSGGGHGMSGIAQALFAAWKILGEDSYLKAARDAMAFEREIFRPEWGSWPDLRDYPAKSCMHGYCSGAPGIGIMLQKMKEEGYSGETEEWMSEHVRKAMQELPLRERDHLCCGNSALAEYYMTVGDFGYAGKLLYAMRKRKEQSGNYCYMSFPYSNIITVSLFFGLCGTAYEMLRYADPESILSVI